LLQADAIRPVYSDGCWGGLALLFLCRYSSLAWLDLNEQAPKAAEDKNKSRRVDAPVSAKTDRASLTFDPE
jgi:hypothetical protein